MEDREYTANFPKLSKPTGDQVVSWPAVGTDDTVYIGSNDHNLYAINADGTKKWAVATGSVAMYSSPAIASDSTIYVGSWDHNL